MKTFLVLKDLQQQMINTEGLGEIFANQEAIYRKENEVMGEKLQLMKTDGETKSGTDITNASQVCHDIIDETDRQIGVQTKFLDGFRLQTDSIKGYQLKFNNEIDAMKKDFNQNIDKMVKSSTDVQAMIKGQLKSLKADKKV